MRRKLRRCRPGSLPLNSTFRKWKTQRWGSQKLRHLSCTQGRPPSRWKRRSFGSLVRIRDIPSRPQQIFLIAASELSLPQQTERYCTQPAARLPKKSFLACDRWSRFSHHVPWCEGSSGIACVPATPSLLLGRRQSVHLKAIEKCGTLRTQFPPPVSLTP